MKTYLKLVLNAKTQEELNNIVDGLVTTRDDDPIITAEGDCYIELPTPEALVHEAFALGLASAIITIQHDIADPFSVAYVELEEPPVGI
jgi:hypothetical protein